jgi:uncharacterized protein (TIGR03000 family)
LAGYGLGAWGTPYGGWGSYGANQPISAPLLGNGGMNGGMLASNGDVDDSNMSGEEDNEEDTTAGNSQLASNNSEEETGESEEDTLDARGAIHLALPNRDAQVYLNGQLVKGEGTHRVLFTPEFAEGGKPEKFEVQTVWQDNGRENKRDANVEVAEGEGIAVNFTRPIDPKAPSFALYSAAAGDEEPEQLGGAESTGSNGNAESRPEGAGMPEHRGPVSY